MTLTAYWIPIPEIPLGFPNFRQLPAELRLKIWQDALPGPRTIHLVNRLTRLPSSSPSSPDGDESASSGYSPIGEQYVPPGLPLPRKSKPARRRMVSHCMSTVRCPREIISMLHTCRESRLEALSRYQPLFAPKSLNDPRFRLHYFDPLVDGIFLEEIWPWVGTGNSKPTNIFKARHLSISCNAWFFKWAVASPQLLTKSGLLRFKHLEELHIVWRILSQQERDMINKYRFGQYMGPGDLTAFLKRPDAPHDIAFPSLSVHVCVDEIMKQFKKMNADHPDWKIPKVKLMQWATRSASDC